jgi:GNAT superfamily N-acetyltransferase
MTMEPLAFAADRVHAGYHALGNAARSMAGGVLVTNRAHTHVHDANVLVHPVALSASAVDEVIAAIDRVLPPPARPHVHMGAGTPGPLEARFAADGWHLTMTLELILHDRLRSDAPPIAVRRAATDDDWATVRRLYRADHVEEALRDERMPYPEVVTRAIAEVKRAKSPAVRVWIARADDVDCGFFTSWDGMDGIGLVEDLFVLPEHRGRGVARALISRAVADARERGAGPVLIGALIDDTPKDLYRRMGFEPLMVRRCWTRPLRR